MSDSTKQTAQEVLTKLENELNTAAGTLETERDSLDKQRDSYLKAQTAVLNAMRNLSVHKERMLISMVTQLQEQVKSKPSAEEPKVAVVDRSDNL